MFDPSKQVASPESALQPPGNVDNIRSIENGQILQQYMPLRQRKPGMHQIDPAMNDIDSEATSPERPTISLGNQF